MRTLLLLCFLFITTEMTFAQFQTARQRSVIVEATILQNPYRIQLDWVADSTATDYTVYRKSLEDNDWGSPIGQLTGGATSFTDGFAEAEKTYEYAIFKKEFDPVIYKVCAPAEAELRFQVQDMYGIGLCCSFGFGFYKVDGCGEVLAQGDDFGWAATHTFSTCSSTDTCVELTITIDPDMFPNSSGWSLFNNQSGGLIASSGPLGTFLTTRPAYGYIYVANELAPTHSRGRVLVLVEASALAALPDEVDRLKWDLIRDGYKVIIASANRNASPLEVRNQIQTIHNNNSDLQTLFILGNVPVPYSGDIYPDTHTEHRGAWAADTYYGELNGNWTDSVANRATAQFAYNHNVPGDGRFDQDSIPSKMELEVGRVDLHDMPAFAKSEIELLRQYLDKNHRFKTGQIMTIRKALIDDNFRTAFAAPAASGFRNFGPMFSADQIEETDYFTTLKTEPYLFAYGCGSGSHISADGIGSTFDFANDSLLHIFSMLFGSQFGDWDNVNNFLRAPLASGNTLTNCWAGSPPYTFHQMALGKSIGYCIKRSQNSEGGVYLDGPQLVHTALMGDPTLRLHTFRPPSALQVVQNGNTIDLSWSASTDTPDANYHVYRSIDPEEGYILLNTQPIEDLFFMDNQLPQDTATYYYMVKADRLEQTPSGTYHNLTLGVIDSVNFEMPVNVSSIYQPAFTMFPNPVDQYLSLQFSTVNEVPEQISVIDVNGNNRANFEVKPGMMNFEISTSKFSPGVYFLRLRKQGLFFTQRITVIR